MCMFPNKNACMATILKWQVNKLILPVIQILIDFCFLFNTLLNLWQIDQKSFIFPFLSNFLLSFVPLVLTIKLSLQSTIHTFVCVCVCVMWKDVVQILNYAHVSWLYIQINLFAYMPAIVNILSKKYSFKDFPFL